MPNGAHVPLGMFHQDGKAVIVMVTECLKTHERTLAVYDKETFEKDFSFMLKWPAFRCGPLAVILAELKERAMYDPQQNRDNLPALDDAKIRDLQQSYETLAVFKGAVDPGNKEIRLDKSLDKIKRPTSKYNLN